MRNALSILKAAAAILLTFGAEVRGQNSNSVSQTKLPEVLVTEDSLQGVKATPLREEQLVGDNRQPEWTTRRRFATTRVYVAAPWQVEFEQWWKVKFLRDGKADHLFQSEISIGLPYRFQLDFYENIEQNKGEQLQRQGEQIEMRWALADWGKIPLNPTLYAEWKFNDHEPDAYEVKLLLAEEIAPRWHWGFNAFYEQEISGSRESELGFSQAISYTLMDEKLSVGVEMNLERASGPHLNGQPATEFLLGPSVQWRPFSRVHFDFVPLVGLTHDSPRVEAFIVFGIDLGSTGKKHPEIHAPTSLRSH